MNSVRTLDVRAHIDSRPMSAYQWLLLARCFLVITTDGIDVAIMGFLAPAITTASAPPPSCPGTDGAPTAAFSIVFTRFAPRQLAAA
jgi:hypothetical protein